MNSRQFVSRTETNYFYFRNKLFLDQEQSEKRVDKGNASRTIQIRRPPANPAVCRREGDCHRPDCRKSHRGLKTCRVTVYARAHQERTVYTHRPDTLVDTISRRISDETIPEHHTPR